MSLALFFAQHVSNASKFIFRSLRLCVSILLWFDVCWRYGVVRLGWCGILMQAEAVLQDGARSNKHKINRFNARSVKAVCGNNHCLLENHTKPELKAQFQMQYACT